MRHVSAALLFASAPHPKQSREAFSLAEAKRESSTEGFTSRKTRRAEERKTVGSRGRPLKKIERNQTDKVVPLCVFRYSTSLQAVDIINISAASLQRRPLSRLGVLIVSLAGRHWEALVRKLAGKLELLRRFCGTRR